MEIEKAIFKKRDLKDYALKLLNNGFKVFVYHKDKISWLIFSKNKNIGYVSLNDNVFRGFSFSTKHKPNRTTGTGFQIHTEIFKPTIQHALDTFILCPAWASSQKSRESVNKYKNIEEYLKGEDVLKYVKLFK